MKDAEKKQEKKTELNPDYVWSFKKDDVSLELCGKNIIGNTANSNKSNNLITKNGVPKKLPKRNISSNHQGDPGLTNLNSITRSSQNQGLQIESNNISKKIVRKISSREVVQDRNLIPSSSSNNNINLTSSSIIQTNARNILNIVEESRREEAIINNHVRVKKSQLNPRNNHIISNNSNNLNNTESFNRNNNSINITTTSYSVSNHQELITTNSLTPIPITNSSHSMNSSTQVVNKNIVKLEALDSRDSQLNNQLNSNICDINEMIREINTKLNDGSVPLEERIVYEMQLQEIQGDVGVINEKIKDTSSNLNSYSNQGYPNNYNNYNNSDTYVTNSRRRGIDQYGDVIDKIT